MRIGESDLERALRHRRQVLAAFQKQSEREEQEALSARWNEVVNTYRMRSGKAQGLLEYPRGERLFEIIRNDGRVRLLLDYNLENPSPNLANQGQRRQVESILGFERPLEQLMLEAGGRWQAGDYEREAELLEEFAKSNPQSDSILDLAAEARRDAISGASTARKPKRRELA